MLDSNFMFLAKVEGAIVATKKDPNMSGRKLLLLRPQRMRLPLPLAIPAPASPKLPWITR